MVLFKKSKATVNVCSFDGRKDMPVDPLGFSPHFYSGVSQAVPGKVWGVPAEHRYQSRAVGGVIRYAVLSLEKHRTNAKSTPESRYFEMVAGSRNFPASGRKIRV